MPSARHASARWLRGPRRAVLLLVPIVLTAVGALLAGLTIQSVRDDARTQARIAAVAKSYGLRQRQAAVSITAVAAVMTQAGGISATSGLAGQLGELTAADEEEYAELDRLVGDTEDGRAALNAAGAAKRTGLQLAFKKAGVGEVRRIGVLFTVSADRFRVVAKRAHVREEEATARATTVTLVVLSFAVLLVSIAWAVFLTIITRLQRRHVEALKHLADQDPLTGLGNRRALERAGRERCGDGCTVAICDLDGFKGYNDRFGHPAGDALLVQLAERLDVAARDAGVRAFRLGGDEFCVVGALGEDELTALCHDALAADGDGWVVTTSVGTAVVPHDADSIAQALRTADLRLYEVKRARYEADPRLDRRTAVPHAVG